MARSLIARFSCHAFLFAGYGGGGYAGFDTFDDFDNPDPDNPGDNTIAAHRVIVDGEDPGEVSTITCLLLRIEMKHEIVYHYMHG